ncbi:MAG: ribonuclease HII [Actinomycetota bacterium]
MTYKATYRTRTFTPRGNSRSSRTNPVPGVRYEKALTEAGAELIAGVDEVGVGAWAGPVAVGVVVLRPGTRIYKVRDSKLLDPARREWLAERVRSRCLCWSTGLSWPAEIDEVGLSEAMRRAAARAVDGLAVCPDAFLVDGQWNFIERKGELGTAESKVKMIVRGDCESLSIAAASVVAKVARDRLMCSLSSMYSPYLFHSNKGYPSPAHKWALSAFGPSPMHRRLFSPVQRLVDEGTPGRLLPAGRRPDTGSRPGGYR